jgi:hypothetical protein
MYPAGGQARPGTGISELLVAHRATNRVANEWVLLHDILSKSPYAIARRSMAGCCLWSV